MCSHSSHQQPGSGSNQRLIDLIRKQCDSWACVYGNVVMCIYLCVSHTRVFFPGKHSLLSMRGSLRPVTFHALNSQAYTLVSRSPRPSFHRCVFPLLTPLSSSPLSVLWRSAPTTLFLIWEASPFHAGHSSPVWPIRWLVVLVSQPILCLPCPFKDCPSLTLEADVKLSAFPALLCLCWLHFAFFFFFFCFFLLHKLFVSQLTFCFCLFSICLIIKNLFGLRSLKRSYPLGNWSTVSIFASIFN